MKKEKDVRTSVKIAIIVVLKLKCVILTTFIKSWWRDIKRFIGTQIQAKDAFKTSNASRKINEQHIPCFY